MGTGIHDLTRQIEKFKDTIEAAINYGKGIGVNAELVTNLNQALSSVTSVTGLVSVAASYAPILGVGYVLYRAVIDCGDLYLKHKKNTHLSTLIKSSKEQLTILTAQLRQQATHTLQLEDMRISSQRRIRVRRRQEAVNPDEELLQISVQEARNILMYIEPLSPKYAKLINAANNLAKAFFKTYALSATTIETPESLLADISNDTEFQDYLKALSDRDYSSIEPNHYNLNYRLLSHLYNEKIKPTVKKLENKFKADVITIYKDAANFQGDSVEKFNVAILLAFRIAEDNTSELRGIVRRTFDQSAKDAIHSLAEIYLKQREKLMNDPKFLKEVSNATNSVMRELIINVILKRALLGIVAQQVDYFYAPYNIPREAFNGVYDTVSGLYTLVRHPIQTVTDATKALSDPAQTFRNIFDNLKKHPTRVIVSTVVSAAIPCSTNTMLKSLQVTTTTSRTVATISTFVASGAEVSKYKNTMHNRKRKHAELSLVPNHPTQKAPNKVKAQRTETSDSPRICTRTR